ncbi:Uncharacterized protein Fot_40896 [Forsythia ovata]|uniref:Uncharacterized protein n=1 Tax=Forsythia ovata TaxID=205694 RepID=A0ABD1RHS1_9LAMI
MPKPKADMNHKTIQSMGLFDFSCFWMSSARVFEPAASIRARSAIFRPPGEKVGGGIPGSFIILVVCARSFVRGAIKWVMCVNTRMVYSSAGFIQRAIVRNHVKMGLTVREMFVSLLTRLTSFE